MIGFVGFFSSFLRFSQVITEFTINNPADLNEILKGSQYNIRTEFNLKLWKKILKKDLTDFQI